MANIRKRGTKWQVQIRRTGQRSISKSFIQRRDAETWARQMEVKADRRELPEDPKVLEGYTLGQLVVRYRDTVSIRKRGGDYERILLKAFLRHPICSRRLSELSAADFAGYRDDRLQDIKPASLKRQLTPIHNLFEIARDEWELPIAENPLDRLKLHAPDNRRERRLKPEEFEKLIEAAQSCQNPYIIPIIRLAVETGMRRGEIISICWDHFDLETRTLLIPHTKNGYARTIPLTSSAVRILKDIDRLEDRLFPITANAFRLNWERVKRRARIEDLHFHDLRHEAISRFFEMGLTAPEVALISGHRDMRMLFRYTHPLKELIIDKLDSCGPSRRLLCEPS